MAYNIGDLMDQGTGTKVTTSDIYSVTHNTSWQYGQHTQVNLETDSVQPWANIPVNEYTAGVIASCYANYGQQGVTPTVNVALDKNSFDYNNSLFTLTVDSGVLGWIGLDDNGSVTYVPNTSYSGANGGGQEPTPDHQQNIQAMQIWDGLWAGPAPPFGWATYGPGGGPSGFGSGGGFSSGGQLIPGHDGEPPTQDNGVHPGYGGGR